MKPALVPTPPRIRSGPPMPEAPGQPILRPTPKCESRLASMRKPNSGAVASLPGSAKCIPAPVRLRSTPAILCQSCLCAYRSQARSLHNRAAPCEWGGPSTGRRAEESSKKSRPCSIFWWGVQFTGRRPARFQPL
jgi:hypothetical protein